MAAEPPAPPEPPTPPPPPPPAPPPMSASQQKTLMLVLAYFWILALIPLLVEKNDREVQWHAKHGLVLCVAEFILYTALGIMAGILHFLWVIFLPLFPILALGILVLHVIAILKALKGERLIIPGISEYANKF